MEFFRKPISQLEVMENFEIVLYFVRGKLKFIIFNIEDLPFHLEALEAYARHPAGDEKKPYGFRGMGQELFHQCVHLGVPGDGFQGIQDNDHWPGKFSYKG